MLLKRNTQLDIQNEHSEFLFNTLEKSWLNKKYLKRLTTKNKKDIEKEIKNIKEEKKLELIVLNLKKLYHIWEFLKLKQEAIRYIKEWWVHKDINFYLRKAIDNETKYKIDLKNKKIENKYNIIKQLYKNWDYDTVIRESEDIISREWDI